MQVAPPAPGSAGRWWPDLYLKKGRQLQEITPAQCGLLMENYRAGRGFSEMPCSSIALHDVNGCRIGHVSYNGRVWLHDVGGDVEIPVAGYKTVAEHEAEGWADLRVKAIPCAS